MMVLIGWGGIVNFVDSWVYDGAVEIYVLDVEMVWKLWEVNLEVFWNIIGWMLEVNGWGFW